MIPLASAFVRADDAAWAQSKFEFDIVVTSRSFRFRANTRDHAQEWLVSLFEGVPAALACRRISSISAAYGRLPGLRSCFDDSTAQISRRRSRLKFK